jgi:hypothetical protein
MKNRYILPIALAIIFPGCENNQDLRLLCANTDITAYTQPDSSKIKKFTIHKGEYCSVGKKVITKVYAFRKVLCANKGIGWIIATVDGSYKILNESNFKKNI